ncbi:MAG: tetratricopeptide repeat protein [Hyphomicrobiales bacterium]
MRTRKGIGGVLGRRFALAGALVALPALMAGTASAQSVDDLGSQFYSFVPAAPTIEAPKSNDSLSLWQGEFKSGQDAYRAGDFTGALQHFQRAADAGSTLANWYLGNMYRLGRGVAADQGKAFGYYKAVAMAYDAEQPNTKLMRVTVDSLVRVADAYRAGVSEAGIDKDVPRALNLYSMAAGHGHPAALYGIGLIYLAGDGIQQRPDQGVKWLMRAARKRYAPAETLLGDLYWDGKIVEQDRTRAIMWYRLAQQTARPDTQPQITDRFDQILSASTDEEKTNGEALAAQWSQQYPAALSKGPDEQ